MIDRNAYRRLRQVIGIEVQIYGIRFNERYEWDARLKKMMWISLMHRPRWIIPVVMGLTMPASQA